MQRVSLERGKLDIAGRATLLGKTAGRHGAEQSGVGGVGAHKHPLGEHVSANQPTDVVAEQAGAVCRRDPFMWSPPHQGCYPGRAADVMQQGRGDQFGPGVGVRSEGGRLQGVLELVDGLAAIGQVGHREQRGAELFPRLAWGVAHGQSRPVAGDGRANS